jgi:hypothetical protein
MVNDIKTNRKERRRGQRLVTRRKGRQDGNMTRRKGRQDSNKKRRKTRLERGQREECKD